MGIINVETKTVNRDFAGWWPLVIFLCLFLAASSTAFGAAGTFNNGAALSFGPAHHLGTNDKNPSTPFLRYAPDGRLYAVWTEDDPAQGVKAKPAQSGHQHSGEMAPAPMRQAMLAWTADGGKTWSSPRRVNRDVEAIEDAEGGPKIAFGADSRASVVWSIPDAKGNKMRANIRLAMEDGKGGFTPARTLNDIKDTARFPLIESMPDNTLLAAWIDRRIDNPNPRQLYLMRVSRPGQEVTKSYAIGDGP